MSDSPERPSFPLASTEPRPKVVTDDFAVRSTEPPEQPRSFPGELSTVRALVARLVPGTRIDDKFEVDVVLGRGGMGVVVGARHVELGRGVALKFLCQNQVSDIDEDVRARFRREAKINARLQNEHITRVLDVGTWEGTSYIVMERLEGVDLRKRIRSAGGPLPLSVAVDYTLQLCEGLAEAHALGIVHRDLKPGNLFVTRNTDGSDLLKIMDFGISKWKAGSIDELTRAGTVLGSPRYMSPEQIFGTGDIDTRADVWSIGAILYEMLSGRTPYLESDLTRFCHEVMAGPPPPLTTVAPGTSKALSELLARCLERDLAKRLPSVVDLAGGLLEAVDRPAAAMREKLAVILQQPATTRTPPTVGKAPPPAARPESPPNPPVPAPVAGTSSSAATTKRLRFTLVAVTGAVALGLGALAITRPSSAPSSAPKAEPAAPSASAAAPSSAPSASARPAASTPTDASSRPVALPPSPVSTARPVAAPGRTKSKPDTDDIPATR